MFSSWKISCILIAVLPNSLYALKISSEKQTPDCATGDWETFGTCVLPVNGVHASAAGDLQQMGVTTANSQTLCQVACETFWKDEIVDGGFNTGGTNSYKSDFDTLSRGCCQYDSAATTDNCDAFFLDDKDIDIFEGAENNYGIQNSQTGGATDELLLLSTDCATDELGGDPHVVNVKGEKFDILQDGNFSVLSIHAQNKWRIQDKSLLQVDMHVTRVGDSCGEAYIQNITLGGSWISNMGHELLQIRAQPSFIEVGLDGEWKPAAQVSSRNFLLYNSKTLIIELESEFALTVDIRNFNKAFAADAQAKVHSLGWSFLNMKFSGIKKLLKKNTLKVGGLIGDDDHQYATKLPEHCTSFTSEVHNLRNRLQSTISMY